MNNLKEYIRILLENNKQYFYHTSNQFLPIGTILTSRKKEYENEWGQNKFYTVLETYRPKNFLAHKDAVFMFKNIEEADMFGGKFIFKVLPEGKIEKHDINWGSEISSLIDQSYEIKDKKIRELALNYWLGVPSPNEQLWEYLAIKAKIVDVEEF